MGGGKQAPKLESATLAFPDGKGSNLADALKGIATVANVAPFAMAAVKGASQLAYAAPKVQGVEAFQPSLSIFKPVARQSSTAAPTGSAAARLRKAAASGAPRAAPRRQAFFSTKPKAMVAGSNPTRRIAAANNSSVQLPSRAVASFGEPEEAEAAETDSSDAAGHRQRY